MEDIFHQAQLGLAKHRKCAEKLHALQRKSESSAFAEDFFGYVACVLPVFKREPAAERAVEFVVKYLTEAEDEDAADQDELICTICMALLGLSDAKDKAVRFRVCQLVGGVMNAMPAEAEVNEDLFSVLEERMLHRCRDKVPVVRACALRALFRLQDPSTPDDSITLELLRMMTTDSSAEVRMAAISTIAPSKPAIRALLGRTRDVSESVRKHALTVIRDKVEMRWLTISQRSALLDQSLSDRTPSVRAACVELCRGWLRHAGKDVLVLLKGLDVSTHESSAERVVQALLEEAETRALVASASSDWAALCPESILCLRLHLEWLAAEAKRAADGPGREEEALAAALPELGAYCEALHRAVESCRVAPPAGEDGAAAAAAAYTLVQLLRVCPQLDMADEHGRAELEAELCGLLKDLGVADELLAPLVVALGAACLGEGERFQRLMHELISEVDDPLEAEGGTADDDPESAEARLHAEQKRMLVQARLVALHAEVKERVEEEDFEAAAALKKEAAALHAELAELPASRGTPEDEAALRASRCLKLAEQLMRAPNLNLAKHEMDLHADASFLPALAAPRPKLRALALRCLGLRALGCPAQAAKTWPLFAKALAHDQLPVQLAALGACTDLLMVHPPEAILPVAGGGGGEARGGVGGGVDGGGKGGAAGTSAHTAGAPLAPVEDANAAAVLELLMPLLRGSEGVLRSAAALAGCRLLHTGRVASSALTARLLLLYFQADADGGAASVSLPSSEVLSNSALLGSGLVEMLCEPNQFLSVFFAASSSSSQLGAALLPAVRAVLAAPPGSPEAAVPLDALASFVLALTRPTDESGNTVAVHESIALALCCEALSAPDELEGRMLPRAFAQLVLPAGRCSRLPALAELLRRLEASLTDKPALKHTQKLSERVAALSVYIYIYTYIYLYVRACVCVCVFINMRMFALRRSASNGDFSRACELDSNQ